METNPPIVNSENTTHHFYPTTDHNNFNGPTIYQDQLQQVMILLSILENMIDFYLS
jgi:hypothetical protein